MSLGLYSVEILPQLTVSIIELSSTATPIPMAALPPILEYHPGANPMYEEDPLEETSTAASRAPDVAAASRAPVMTESNHAPLMEVLSRDPRIIHMPFVPRGRGARGRSRLESRHS